MANEWVLTVSQLNDYVRIKLSGDPMLRGMRVQGEISGFKRHYSGHLYFTLKDENACVQCVMFRQNAMGLSFEPADGMKVVLTASASLYVKEGKYQLYADDMRMQGAGELYQQFEALKRRLAAEGLFDEALKRPLPLRPRTVGIVTSRSGAVLRDIVRIARRRDPNVNFLLAPVAVQGAGAAKEIVAALELLNHDGQVDVILCGRGGGSIEDLWPFNEEIVARAVRTSKIPVVSCVGHETDFTIADFAADLRAPTPSAAAELAVPVAQELLDALWAAQGRAERAVYALLNERRAQLNGLMGSYALSAPAQALTRPRAHALELLARRLDEAEMRAMDKKKHALELMTRALAGLDPAAVLGRGYAVIEKDGSALSSARELTGEVGIRMRDGTRRARILTETDSQV